MSKMTTIMEDDRLKSVAIKTVCAWCGEFMGGESGAIQISHGICQRCQKRYIEQMRTEREAVWEPWQDEGGGEG